MPEAEDAPDGLSRCAQTTGFNLELAEAFHWANQVLM